MPLRDDENPNGVRHLKWLDKLKVSKSNQLYDLTADLVRFAHKHGLLICVENPRYSLFWATSFWLRVSHQVMYTVFHSCQYGSRRQKKTMLAHNYHTFAALNLQCPGECKNHSHAKWGLSKGRFATAQETAYPFPLARCIAQAFVQALLECGLVAPPETIHVLESDSHQILQAIRAQSNLQPKASHLPPLVQEFKQVVHVRGKANMLPSQDTVRLSADFELPSTVDSLIKIIPQQSKLLKTSSTVADSMKGGEIGEISSKLCSDKPAAETVCEQKWGGTLEPGRICFTSHFGRTSEQLEIFCAWRVANSCDAIWHCISRCQKQDEDFETEILGRYVAKIQAARGWVQKQAGTAHKNGAS